MYQSGRISEAQLDEWYRLYVTHYPLDEHLVLKCFGFRPDSPLSAACLARARQEQRRMFPELAIRPCDIHVLGLGEPPCRWWTKLGGLPYRPKSQLWPRNPAGKPYDFICQFWVGESADILPPCPGDVLLVFAEGGSIYTPSPFENDLYFEWQIIDQNLELVDESDCLGKEYEDLIAYGCPYRTFDFIDPFPVRAWADLVLTEFEMEHRFQLDRDELLRLQTSGMDYETEKDLAFDLGLIPSRFSGMKIGGEPCWIHAAPSSEDEKRNPTARPTREVWRGELPDPDEWGNPYRPTHDEILSLCFIAGFGAWYPETDKPWPWINREEPISHRDVTKRQLIEWAGGFRDHFFLDSNGQVRLAHEFNSRFRERK